MDIREKYRIPEISKIVLYAGNISRNKNQEQMIRAFCLLPDALKVSTYVLFCGRNIEEGYQLNDFIEESGYKKNLIICGNINKEIMPCYYQQSDAVILLSKAEGFGLSLVEGMHFGLPCMTFTDLDAFEDIYDEHAVVGITERSDIKVAQGIEILLLKKWEKEVIKQYSKKFESEIMVNNYINKYKEVIYG